MYIQNIALRIGFEHNIFAKNSYFLEEPSPFQRIALYFNELDLHMPLCDAFNNNIAMEGALPVILGPYPDECRISRIRRCWGCWHMQKLKRFTNAWD
ncbi:no significant blast hit, RV strand overlap [Histoplasma capsulatum var. duboisii H88]|uniref:No significant blast hit, RV strand overlap n=1 Tax=Ajellomyces capsulatus (strain H88) TaxID=544711 RepID=A0A8A1LBH9_AJEC8|nr:no significant blast hit, RV strand overlap [Histoplasma capsulatum var. duboisii H88]